MIQACVWLDQGSHEWENWVKTTLAASEKLGEAFKPGAEFVRAVDMARRGDPKADEVLNAIADSGDVNENRAGALLVLARRAMCAGKREEAEGIVSRMPEQGAQHVCAVARRIMASN
jgi:thioredoxin-like negative regulator of GroEL